MTTKQNMTLVRQPLVKLVQSVDIELLIDWLSMF